MLDIAGVNFDLQLAIPALPLTLAGGVPQCLGDSGFNGCGDGQSQSLGTLNISDDFMISGIDGSLDFFDGTYTLSPKQTAVPEPGSLWLFGVGLAGLAFAFLRQGLRRRATG